MAVKRDAIDDLVDWQLGITNPNVHVCQFCDARWTGRHFLFCPTCWKYQRIRAQ